MNKQIKGFWVFIGRTSLENFRSVSSFMNSGAFTIIAIALLAAAVTFLCSMTLERIPMTLEEGAIAQRNIKADRNYEIIDEEATSKFKDEARLGVAVVYDQDDTITDGIIRRLHEAFAGAKELLAAADIQRSLKNKLSEGTVNLDKRLSSLFSEKLGITLSSEQLKDLIAEKFSDRVEFSISSLIKKSMSRPIVEEHLEQAFEKPKGVVVRRSKGIGPLALDQTDERFLGDLSQISTIEEARRKIQDMSVSAFTFKKPRTVATVSAIASMLLEPNCSLNIAETDKRNEEAVANVKNVILKVKAGEMIIREGSRYEPWHIKVLKGMQKEKNRGMYSTEFFGKFLLVLLFIVVPFYLVEGFFGRVSSSRSDHFLMAIVGLVMLAIMRIMLMLGPAVHDSLLFNVNQTVFVYAIPIAGAAMLLRLFLCAELTLTFTIALSVVSGFFIETDIEFAAFCLLTSIAGVIVIADADRRSKILKAGAWAGGIGAIALIGIGMVKTASATEPVMVQDIAWGALFAFLGGIGSSIFTMIGAPIIESVSGYTSDIKLLELANLNHPLLRELIIRAPGTYHHSHMVGILGEAAAESIGANALLVRVGAYYHDIGKMKKPAYFIENAKPTENKHEKLSPNMSALIVAAHVKDGVEMALGAGIPGTIVRMIPEHHGTRLISFFYEKAKEQKEKDSEKVDEKDFVYPGPKPQSREAAILMLADASEAAVRALKEKSTTRIQQTVQRVITDIFMEKQLDECDLTLKDLNDIARAFVRIFLGIYHARIEYPKETDTTKLEVSIVEDTSVDQSNS